MPQAESVMASPVKVQFLTTPSLSQPMRMAFAWLVSWQLATVTRSQTRRRPSRNGRLLHRTTIASSPARMRQLEIETSLDALRWMPSLLGSSGSASTLTRSKTTRSQSVTQ